MKGTWGSRSLPSGSPRGSPEPSEGPITVTIPKPARSVTWSIPSPSSSISRSIISNPPRIHFNQILDASCRRGSVIAKTEQRKHFEKLSWRKLYLSKAKLATITDIAAVMAGFSVVSTVELQINDGAEPALLTAFTVTTALLVATTMMAIMISTCILPHIQMVHKMSGLGHANVSESPHDLLITFIDLSWVLANTVSIFLFTLDVIILSWIKFTYFSVTASICATVVMIPVLIAICVFGIVFYRNVSKHQHHISDMRYQEVERIKHGLDAISIV